MSNVCPVCNSTPLTQQKDKRLFVCSNPKCPVKYFTLVDRRGLKGMYGKRIRRCANCGRYLALLPNGLCEDCAKRLAERG